MEGLYANLERVSNRLTYYKAEPDKKFRGDSGFTLEEEDVFQKIRQYWADKTIPDEEKLRGFEMNLADFDPRDTTYTELHKIALGLEALGIIDTTTGSILTMVDLDFDAAGNQTNKDKKVDVFKYFDEQLKFLNSYIAEGHDFANETLVKLNTGITVMLALEARVQAARAQFLINTTA
jgi:hypothetical protein